MTARLTIRLILGQRLQLHAVFGGEFQDFLDRLSAQQTTQLGLVWRQVNLAGISVSE